MVSLAKTLPSGPGRFMSIDRGILYRRLEAFFGEMYGADWDGLPADKSLFHSRSGCGLPIGNLTSQVFADFCLRWIYGGGGSAW